MGFTVSTGTAYLCAWVMLAGPGSHYSVSVPTGQPAHTILSGIRRQMAEHPDDPRCDVWLDPETLRLCLGWREDGQEAFLPRSLFGLEALANRGDTIDVPHSVFPATMSPSMRARVLHVDFALSRGDARVWIETRDEKPGYLTVERVTDPSAVIPEKGVIGKTRTARPEPLGNDDPAKRCYVEAEEVLALLERALWGLHDHPLTGNRSPAMIYQELSRMSALVAPSALPNERGEMDWLLGQLAPYALRTVVPKRA
ncbi:MAG TPA: hypothetical protein VM687_05300 [Stenotrophomonas sp.]|nr:hypothetical protein [Stenotrophomonas sp.]